MELREQISLKIGINFSELLLKDINEESDRIADEILSLPSGMEKVKECDNCGGNGEYMDGPTDSPQQVQCSFCYATGEIVTDLTVGEAIEVLSKLLSESVDYIPLRIETNSAWRRNIFLPSGERVRVKK